MELIPPAPHFLNSYLEACQETWGHVHSTYILHDPSQYARWKDTIFQQFENEKRGIGLPPGYVPSTTFWLICGERFIGSGNIRHFLNASLREYGGQIGDFIRLSERGKGYGSLLLRMLLSKAEEMGIRETLITCEADNRRSQKHIESLGERILAKEQAKANVYAYYEKRLNEMYALDFDDLILKTRMISQPAIIRVLFVTIYYRSIS